MRVLVIDDSEIALEVAAGALRSAGLDVFTLSTPLGGASALAQHRPDLVLLDIDMPALSGEKAALVFKRQRFLVGLKVILYSGRDAAELEGATRRSGADGWVRKSADGNELVAAVLRHLAA